MPIILIMILFSSTAFANNIYADFNGAYTQTGDLKNQPGLGGTLAVSIHPNVNFFARTIFSSVTKDADTVEETEYSYLLALGGVQALMRIKDSPVYWITDLGFGMADGQAEASNSGLQVGEKGFAFALWTGLLVEATQRISAYLEVGYHYPFYNSELKDADIKGFQALVGIRITVWGKNRSLFGGY